ncbi:hypothetical protein V6Z11_A06G161500 [Gossypium hirsutum]
MVTGNYFLSNGNILLALKCLALFPKINSPSPKSIIYFPEPIQRKRKQAASEPTPIQQQAILVLLSVFGSSSKTSRVGKSSDLCTLDLCWRFDLPTCN